MEIPSRYESILKQNTNVFFDYKKSSLYMGRFAKVDSSFPKEFERICQKMLIIVMTLRAMVIHDPVTESFWVFFLTRYELLLWRKLRIWSFRTRHVWFRTRFRSRCLIYLYCLIRYRMWLRWYFSKRNLIFERFRSRLVSVFKGSSQIQKLKTLEPSEF